MKSAYELAMERLEKQAPTKKLSPEQKDRIAELDTIYRARIAERETFLQGELVKARATHDQVGAEQIKDQLAREVRRLQSEWDEKKNEVHQQG